MKKKLDEQVKDWSHISNLCYRLKHVEGQRRIVLQEDLYDAIRSYGKKYRMKFDPQQRPNGH